MFSNLNSEQISLLALVISLEIFKNFSIKEAEAINNLLVLISANLGIQIAQKELNNDEGNDNATIPII